MCGDFNAVFNRATDRHGVVPRSSVGKVAILYYPFFRIVVLLMSGVHFILTPLVSLGINPMVRSHHILISLAALMSGLLLLISVPLSLALFPTTLWFVLTLLFRKFVLVALVKGS